MTKNAKPTVAEVLQAAEAYHQSRCDRYPKSYDGSELTMCPRFYASYLSTYPGTTNATGRAACDGTREALAQLEKDGRVLRVGRNGRGQPEYVLVTDGVAREMLVLAFERDEANRLAANLGGEAQQMARSAHVTLTVEQARELERKMNVLKDQLDREQSAHAMCRSAYEASTMAALMKAQS